MTGVAGNSRLTGWRVLILRPLAQAGELAGLLGAVGAEPVAVPLLDIAPPADPGPFDLALVDLGSSRFSWIGFTSANAVDAVIRRAAELGIVPAVPADTKVAAVGPGTAAVVRRAGLPVDLVPADKGSADAVASLWPTARPGESVLLPRSEIARPGLPEALLSKGYRVETVTAYRTVVRPLPPNLLADLRADRIDAILFTSPSTVSALADAPIGPAVVLGAIGQPTARAAQSAGRTITYVAEQPTPAALVDGLVTAAGQRTAGAPRVPSSNPSSATEMRVTP